MLGDDTIAAVATAPGAGAIGVVRISGASAVSAAARVLQLRTGTLSEMPSHTLRRVVVVDPANGERVDEALCSVMRAPRSYTGEDVVELSCHGSPVVLRRVISLLADGGVRLAEPGEFTRRAYLNGRMDLSQAEAVTALIGARTERAAILAARSLSGALSDRITAIRERLLELVAGLEVALDFPDEHVGVSALEAAKMVMQVVDDASRLLTSVREGRMIHEGLTVAIIGAPNAGKSSLLNRLLETDRAIVSPTPGTTRDLVEGWLAIDGVPLRLVDTAGLAATEDPIEAEGMRRTRRAAHDSDLVLAVLDGSRPDRDALEPVMAGGNALLVINKSDLPPHPSVESLVAVRVSALTGDGIGGLLTSLKAWLGDRIVDDADEAGIVASLRQIEALEALRGALVRGEGALSGDVPPEAALVDLREALRLAGTVVGIDVSELVLDRIFATFCLGK